jgi:predicted XRE-type DNA-binding protein
MNVRDSLEIGTHSAQKLTENDASAIKSLLRLTKLTHKQIAKQFGVTRQRVSAINKGVSWGWIQEGSWIK